MGPYTPPYSPSGMKDGIRANSPSIVAVAIRYHSMLRGRVTGMLSLLASLAIVSAYSDADLLVASEMGDMGTLEKIISSGSVDLEMKWKERLPIHVAAENGKADFITRLLENGVHVDVKDFFGYRAITKAVMNGQLEAVKALVSGGADITAEDDVDDKKYYLLETAGSRGHLDVARYLVSIGANVNYESDEGNTPLIMASLNGFDEVVSYFISAGANISMTNFQDSSALTAAAYKGHHKVVKILIESGANPDHQNMDNSFPLILSARDNTPKVMRELLRGGANPNLTDSSGSSPLLVVSKSGHINCMTQLLAKHADLELTDNTKQTALHYSYVNNHKGASKLLALAGASHGSSDKHDGIAAPHIPKVPVCYWYRGLLKRYGLSMKQTKGTSVGRKACDYLATEMNLRGSIVKLLDMISFYGYRATVDRLGFDSFMPADLGEEALEDIKRAARGDLKSMHTKDYKQYFRETDEEEMEKNLPGLLRKFGAELPEEPKEDDLSLADIANERVTRREFHRAAPEVRPDHFKEGRAVPVAPEEKMEEVEVDLKMDL